MRKGGLGGADGDGQGERLDCRIRFIAAVARVRNDLTHSDLNENQRSTIVGYSRNGLSHPILNRGCHQSTASVPISSSKIIKM